MKMLKEIRNLVSFLTTIPVGMDPDCLTDSANYMYLFPLVGVVIGLSAGLFAWLLFNILASLVVGILTIGFILLLTGVHHTDGLLDFGDGIMVQGPPQRKIEIMHDQRTGAGGLALGLVTVIATASCIAELTKNSVIPSLIVSEISAKLAMVIMAWVGRSAHEGTSTYFVNAMHGQHRYSRLIVAIFIAFGIAIFILHIVGLLAVIACVAVAFALTAISNRHFKGVTGDVFGAGNELARLASLIVILVMFGWA